jgi:hypothetical protein
MRNLIASAALLALLGSPAAMARSTDSAKSAAEPAKPATIWPIEAISYEFGSKRAVGYFETRDGKCQVTLMIAEATAPDQVSPFSAARLSLPIGQGESAVLTSEEGRRITLTCGAGARTVVVNAAKTESER